MKRRDAIRNTALFLGAATIAGSTGILQSCQPSMKESWLPEFYTEDEILLIAEIAETILPKTDTPGAKDAKVERYLDLYAMRFLKLKEQEDSIKALELFEATAQKLHNKSFVLLEKQKMESVLQAMIDDPAEGEGSPSDVFMEMRRAVNQAFFTSEVGVTKVLDYDPIPGDYIGEIKLSETKGLIYSG